jgi:dihydroorotate dehydrogenase
MRLRTVAVLGVATAVAAGVVVRRRRHGTPPPPAVQLGLDDGVVVRLGIDDPGVPALRARAADVRAALEAGR